MIKDFYQDALKLFTRPQDIETLKHWHELKPDDLKADSDDVFFAVDYDTTINGLELMRRTLRVSSKAWTNDPNEEPDEPLAEFIRQAWYDLQYYRWHSPVRYLSKMVADNSYKPMPDELVKDYHDYNWYCKHEGAVNKHVAQREAYNEFLTKYNINDVESARCYLQQRGVKFDMVPFDIQKEAVTD